MWPFILLTLIVLLSILFESGKHLVETGTEETFQPIVEAFFSELATLGFIGALAFLLTYNFNSTCEGACSVMQRLSEKVLGEPDELQEIFEKLHFLLFAVSVVFIMVVLILLRFSLKNGKLWTSWEEDMRDAHDNFVAVNPNDSIEKKKKALTSMNHVEDLMSDKVPDRGSWWCSEGSLIWEWRKPIEQQRAEYYRIRHRFVDDEDEVVETEMEPDFDFCRYLKKTLALTFAEVIEITPVDWLVLWACFGIVFGLYYFQPTLTVWSFLVSEIAVLIVALVVQAKLVYIRYNLVPAVDKKAISATYNDFGSLIPDYDETEHSLRTDENSPLLSESPMIGNPVHQLASLTVGAVESMSSGAARSSPIQQLSSIPPPDIHKPVVSTTSSAASGSGAGFRQQRAEALQRKGSIGATSVCSSEGDGAGDGGDGAQGLGRSNSTESGLNSKKKMSEKTGIQLMPPLFTRNPTSPHLSKMGSDKLMKKGSSKNMLGKSGSEIVRLGSVGNDDDDESCLEMFVRRVRAVLCCCCHKKRQMPTKHQALFWFGRSGKHVIIHMVKLVLFGSVINLAVVAVELRSQMMDKSVFLLLVALIPPIVTLILTPRNLQLLNLVTCIETMKNEPILIDVIKQQRYEKQRKVTQILSSLQFFLDQAEALSAPSAHSGTVRDVKYQYKKLLRDKATRAHLDDLRELFDFYDEDRSGSIDQGELADLLAQMGQQKSPEEVERLFRLMDADQSNSVEFEEFAVVICANKKNKKNMDPKAIADRMWGLFDADGDGEIDCTELTERLKSLGQNWKTDDIDSFFKDIDKDGSGAIEKHEFVDFITENMGPMHKSGGHGHH